MKLTLISAVLCIAGSLAPLSGAQAQEQTMVMAMTATPKGFDPDIWVPGQIEAAVNVYEGLTRYGTRIGPKGQPEVDPAKIEPHMAESWTVSKDGKTYLFKLKHGIKSPYGNEFTANDIVWTYEKSAIQKRTGQFMRNAARVEKVEAVSRYEVRYTLSDPNRVFLGALTLHLPAIFDSVEAKKHATPDDPYATKWLANNTAGYGPYHLQSVQSGQQAVFVVNPNYAFKKPYYTRMIWREVPSAATRVALARTGQVQYAEQIPLQQLSALRADRTVKVDSVPGYGSASVRMNPRFPPFNKEKVRQAVAYATDYAAIGEAVFLGQGTRSRSLLNPPVPGAANTYKYETDYNKAKQLLAEAGYPNGVDITLEYSTNWWWEEPLALQMQASLAKAGIRVTPKRIPPTEMLARRTSNVWTVPMLTHLTSSFVPDPSYNMFLAAHCKGSSNVNANCDAAMDKLIDASLVERDDKKWMSLIGQAQQLHSDSATFIETFLPGTHEVFAACVTGYLWKPHNRLVWKDLVCKK